MNFVMRDALDTINCEIAYFLGEGVYFLNEMVKGFLEHLESEICCAHFAC